MDYLITSTITTNKVVAGIGVLLLGFVAAGWILRRRYSPFGWMSSVVGRVCQSRAGVWGLNAALLAAGLGLFSFGATDPIGRTAGIVHCGWDCEHYLGNARWLLGQVPEAAYRPYLDIPVYQYLLALRPTQFFGGLISVSTALLDCVLLYFFCIRCLRRSSTFASLAVFFLLLSAIFYTYSFYVAPTTLAILVSILSWWAFLRAKWIWTSVITGVGLLTKTLFLAPYGAQVLFSRKRVVALALLPWLAWEFVAGLPTWQRTSWVSQTPLWQYRTLSALLGAMFDVAGYLPPAHIALGWTTSPIGSVLDHRFVLPLLPLTLLGAVAFRDRRVRRLARDTFLLTLIPQFIVGFNATYFMLLIPFIAVFNAEAVVLVVRFIGSTALQRREALPKQAVGQAESSGSAPSG